MLTTDQLAAIDRHLRKDNWLLNEDLITELTDHYANAIADHLSRGITFETALNDVHKGFDGRKGLLKMEETYQTEKSKQLDVFAWREVRRMTEGDRWPIAIGVFAILYSLNNYFDAADIVDSALYIGMAYISFLVLLAVITSFIFFFKGEVNAAITQTTPKLFIWGYGLGILLTALNKYLLPQWQMAFPLEASILLNSLLETLCIVYYVAAAIALRKYFQQSPITKPA